MRPVGTDGRTGADAHSQIEQLVRVNTVSPIVLTKYVVRSMLSEGGGRIVNIASIIGFTGYRGLSVYGATKASMLGFTRSLAREVGRHGVNVNAVAPGFIETDMTQGLGDEQRGQVARRSALQRLPEIADVANAVEFLLGDKARNITGTVLTVDAGSTAVRPCGLQDAPCSMLPHVSNRTLARFSQLFACRLRLSHSCSSAGNAAPAISVLIQLMNVHRAYALTSPVDTNRFLRRWTSLSRTAFCGTILLSTSPPLCACRG